LGNGLLRLNPDGPRTCQPWVTAISSRICGDSRAAEDDVREAHVGDDGRPRSPEGGRNCQLHLRSRCEVTLTPSPAAGVEGKARLKAR